MLTPDMPALLTEMGVNYNPAKLAEALKGREVEISARAVKVASTLAGCIGNVLKVHGSLFLPLPWLAIRMEGCIIRLCGDECTGFRHPLCRTDGYSAYYDQCCSTSNAASGAQQAIPAAVADRYTSATKFCHCGVPRSAVGMW